jgi:16S rRNA (guanine527-N7)-methyltransferase
VTTTDEAEVRLHEALGESQRLGFLGDWSIGEVIAHSRVFVDALSLVEGTVIDLGSGGGVPGLVLAVDRPDLAIVLLDRRAKRTDFLSRMVRRLELTDHTTVVTADIDEVLRKQPPAFDAVVARGFGPPEPTLRTAVKCLASDGIVVISEPPTGDRWDPELLSALEVFRVPSDSRLAVFERGLPT